MYIGIDLGGTTMTAGVVDDHFAIVKKKTFDVHPEWGADAVIEELITLTRELLSDNDINEELQWIGIGSPRRHRCEKRDDRFFAQYSF